MKIPETNSLVFLELQEFNYQIASYKNALDLSSKLVGSGMYSLPSHIIIDKNGKVVFRYIGDHEDIGQILNQGIQKYL